MFDIKSIIDTYLTQENKERIDAVVTLLRSMVVTRVDFKTDKYTVSLYKVPQGDDKPDMIRADLTVNKEQG